MKKKNIFIAIIIILLLVATAILTLLNKGNVKIELRKENPISSISQQTKKEGNILVKQEEKKVADSLVVSQERLKSKARFFIERYNTYSSDNNQENLRSLLPHVSDGLAKKIEARLTEKIKQNDSFFSLQTKVLSLSLLDFIDNKKAIFTGQVQEQEAKEGATEVHYKPVILEFIYEGQEWKVNSIKTE
ncbi:hypothetical protein B6D52_01460 [Candidatus Parcubacteria bacterium 4484_255]|nr:MAG: hypothetical protein B6D52_01460 [Candidatus Parcubacteria bacterium 4484_255]